MSNAISPADMAFKSLALALIEAAGGLHAAAAATRVGKTSLGNYQHRFVDQFMPVDVVARLEALAPEPLITAELARRAGYVLVPVAPALGGALHIEMARLGAKVGVVFSAYAEALRDGRVTPAEAAEMARELGDVIRVATAAQQAVAIVAGEG